jgi:hypothetical protein
MMPAVPPPKSAAIRVPVELKLKRNYKYDSRKRVFVSGSGTSFDPHRDLPKDTRIVYKVPALAAADESGLSQPEKELRRYMQVILPRAYRRKILSKWSADGRAWKRPQSALMSACRTPDDEYCVTTAR